MSSTVNVGGVWCVYSDCINCGVRYTVPQNMWDKQQKEGGFHHCPNGHSQGWNKTECEDARVRRERDRLRQQLAQKDDEIRREQDRAEHQKNRAAVYKGHLTKVKKRVGKGTCPCCNRHFVNVEQHMKTQHPDYADAAQ